MRTENQVTVTVSRQTRDMLKAQADARGMSMVAYLESRRSNLMSDQDFPSSNGQLLGASASSASYPPGQMERPEIKVAQSAMTGVLNGLVDGAPAAEPAVVVRVLKGGRKVVVTLAARGQAEWLAAGLLEPGVTEAVSTIGHLSGLSPQVRELTRRLLG